MGVLIYWPPLAHLAILLAVAVVCLFRLDQLPNLPGPDQTVTHVATSAQDDNTLFPLPDVGAYDGVLTAMDARPLFAATRRPAALDTAAPAPQGNLAPAEPEGTANLALQLIAVIGQGRAMRALIVTAGDSEELWVQEGDDVAGWQVASIATRTVVLQLGDRSMTFHMFD